MVNQISVSSFFRYINGISITGHERHLLAKQSWLTAISITCSANQLLRGPEVEGFLSITRGTQRILTVTAAEIQAVHQFEVSPRGQIHLQIPREDSAPFRNIANQKVYSYDGIPNSSLGQAKSENGYCEAEELR